MTALDFIDGYANYADVLEAPRILHEIVAIQIVATVLNRNGVRIRLGAMTLPVDLWDVIAVRQWSGAKHHHRTRYSDSRSSRTARFGKLSSVGQCPIFLPAVCRESHGTLGLGRDVRTTTIA